MDILKKIFHYFKKDNGKANIIMFVAIIILLCIVFLLLWQAGIAKNEIKYITEKNQALEQIIEGYIEKINKYESNIVDLNNVIDKSGILIAIYENKIDSLKEKLDSVLNNIIQLPPDMQIKLFDQLTGDGDYTIIELRPNVYAVVDIKRIVSSNMLMTKAQHLEEENAILQEININNKRIIDLQLAVIGNKELIISSKDSIIDLRKQQYYNCSQELENTIKREGVLKIANYIQAGIIVAILIFK